MGAEAVTPIAHLFDNGDEGATKGCQLVLGVTAHSVDYALFYHAILHKFAQLLRDYPFTCLGYGAVYFTGSPRAAKQFIYDVRFPLAAHHFEGNAETAIGVYRNFLVIHGAKVVIIPLNTAKIIGIRQFFRYDDCAYFCSPNNKIFIMREIKVNTKRGVQLDGVLFEAATPATTVMIAITGIHGNFYSNPFYYNIGDTLNAGGVDFIYAQTCDAFGTIKTRNVITDKNEIIGSWNERFADALDDVEAYINYAESRGYRHIILAGHSLGANKVIYYLSQQHDPRVDHFLLLSPANLDYMTSGVTTTEREIVRRLMAVGVADEMLPFPLMGWVQCKVATASDWLFDSLLNNVHTAPDGDFAQVEQITHGGALLIGTYDNFTDGDPSGFLRNINDHMPTASNNRLLFIERTGHTYQQKQQELADIILALLQDWRNA